MKKIFFVLLFISASIAFSQDTTRFVRWGFVPYQFLSRSSGIYVGYDFKNIGFEFRPTYTYATNFHTNFGNPATFFYQGINNNFIFYSKVSDKCRFGFICGIRYWWFNNQDIYTGNHGEQQNKETSSKWGYFAGVEICRITKTTRQTDLDGAVYFNLTVTGFTGTTTDYGFYRNGTYIPYLYPSKSSFSSASFKLAIGLKFGGRKQIKTQKHN